MRIQSHAVEQYQTNAGAARSEAVTDRPGATVTTSAFGFRLGRFGLDYESSRVVVDPALSPESRRARQQAAAFSTQAEVAALRASLGSSGADHRNQAVSGSSAPGQTASPARMRSALAAYAVAAREASPPPGTMLASIV
ncbi:hypothetical protein GKC30_07135 [Pseudodesulfovibrio sp. F-1]|uniref:Uncharacterized protein n=1 Tax=Pseudodesulfovibrio alkaliphilus TaxID=2661613 RepID=A0A7K1KMX2_9BACT|nr:hypothetical protein [Pseudodesulfovibrio alkaliphilus]MUM77400.1 hypothetical protein [Pseudodesulfovibrio alkaliphilus]